MLQAHSSTELETRADGKQPLGLYCHVPFCATRCDFCAFYEEAPHRADIDRYLAGVETELAACADLNGGPLPVETLFWGGGTPGLLLAKDIERLGHACLSALAAPPAEWTIELAPSTVKPDKARALRALGVNRASLGVQSFNELTLDALGRRHSPKLARTAYETLREAGFDNINLDLMFAIPGQTFEQWQADMDAALALAPEHISTYCLTFEEDTALWAQLARGEFRRDIEREADFYLRTWDHLEAAGYAQYEVSNFARTGCQCRHNLNTWHLAEWIGVGPSAASQWRGWRAANPADLDRWLESISQQPGTFPPAGAVDIVRATDALLAADALIFGLRMNAGVSLDTVRRRFPEFRFSILEKHWQQLENEGLLQREGNTLRLTSCGRLVADAVGAAIIDQLDSEPVSN